MAITVLSRQTAEHLVEAATAAPSVGNTQPWRFVARPADRVIEVYADPARTLSRGDPRGRAVHIACGAAVLNLRLAVARAGAEPVTRLLPDQRNPLLLAAVRVAGPYRARRGEQDLYAAISPNGNDLRPAAQPPPRALLPALLEAVALEGGSLRLLDPPDAHRILQSIAAARRDARPADGALAELRAFFPATSARPAPAAAGGPQLGVISTRGDDRANWLRAGLAMQRLLLLAARCGLAASPLTPALELPAAALRAGESPEAGHPEIIVRLGGEQASQPALRRPLAQVLRILGRPARQDEDSRPADGRELLGLS